MRPERSVVLPAAIEQPGVQGRALWRFAVLMWSGFVIHTRLPSQCSYDNHSIHLLLLFVR